MIKRFFAILFIFTSMVLGNGAIPTAISKIFLVLAAAPYIRPGSKNISILKPYLLWCIAFVALCWLSLSWAFDRETGVYFISTVTFVYICNITLAALIINLNKPIIYWLKIFMYFALVMSVVFFLQNGINYGVDVSRTGLDINMNTIGMISGIACSIAIYFYKYDKTLNWKYSMLIVAGLFMFIILLTASRKSLVLPLMIYSIFKLISGNNKRFILNVLIISLISVLTLWAVLNIPLLYEMIGYRVDGLLNAYLGEEESIDASTRTRMELVELGMMFFSKRPLLGYGICNFRALYESYFPGRTALYAHNNYIELLVDLGAVGIVLYYIFYIYIIVKLYKLAKREHDKMAIFLLSAIIALVFVQYGFVAFYSPFNNIFLTIVTCYVLVKSNMSRQKLWNLKRRNF